MKGQPMPTPLPIEVTMTLTLDTEVGARYHQTGVDTYDTSPFTLQDAIISEAAAQLVKSMDREFINRLRSEVTAELTRQIDAAVRPVVAAAIEGQFQPTNSYGEKMGPQVTIREMIAKAAANQLNNRNGGFDKKTVLDEAIAATTPKIIAAELKEHVDAVKADLKARLAAGFSDALVAGVMDGLKP